MGYNTFVSMKAIDLIKAAEDPIFNAHLVSAIRLSNAAPMGEKGSIRGPGGAVHASMIAKELGRLPEMDYEIQVAPANHSSLTSIQTVSDAGLGIVTPVIFGGAKQEAGGCNPESLNIMAQVYSDFGHTIEKLEDNLYFEAATHLPRSRSSGFSAEWARLGRYHYDVFEEGQVSFLVRNDGIKELEAAKNLGQTLLDGFHDWWNNQKHIHGVISTNQRSTLHLPTGIEVGNFSNCIEIADLTPKGQSDLILSGQNFARALRYEGTMSEALRAYKLDAPGIDEMGLKHLECVERALSDAGFIIDRLQPDFDLEDPGM